MNIYRNRHVINYVGKGTPYSLQTSSIIPVIYKFIYSGDSITIYIIFTYLLCNGKSTRFERLSCHLCYQHGDTVVQ